MSVRHTPAGKGEHRQPGIDERQVNDEVALASRAIAAKHLDEDRDSRTAEQDETDRYGPTRPLQRWHPENQDQRKEQDCGGDSNAEEQIAVENCTDEEPDRQRFATGPMSQEPLQDCRYGTTAERERN